MPADLSMPERTAHHGDGVKPYRCCDKQRNGDWEGSIGLWYDRASQQFLGSPDAEPLALYSHPEASW